MLISPAYAQAAGGEPSFLVSLLPLILIFIVFWFLLIRPQQKRMREHREMVQATKKGDKIVTSGGIYGTVSRVIDDNALEVEIAQNVKVKLARPTVSENLTRAEQSQSASPANDQGRGGGQKKGLLDRLIGR
ncbi:MAG: preprotein translocase subunit YajC [Alphaproteobacteria bacterium]|jgi:preprotein translocase subunit YajC|nr:preprotein translocase subunit YajC [Alphaproteobacteria bacterium]